MKIGKPHDEELHEDASSIVYLARIAIASFCMARIALLGLPC